MKCPESATFIQTYVDSELTGVDRNAFEEHMLTCQDCARAARLQARFKAAIRGHLSPAKVPADVQARITSALAAETKAPGASRLWTLPRMAPVLAAAGVLVAVFFGAKNRVSPVIEQAVRTHTKGMPLDIRGSDCASVATWFDGKLDFKMHAPKLGKNARCEGGRLINVGQRFAALLRYQMSNNQRLSVMVFDDEDAEDVRSLPRRTVADREIYVGSTRGASTAAYKGSDGLWYVVTSDMDQDSLKEVIEPAVHSVP